MEYPRTVSRKRDDRIDEPGLVLSKMNDITAARQKTEASAPAARAAVVPIASLAQLRCLVARALWLATARRDASDARERSSSAQPRNLRPLLAFALPSVSYVSLALNPIAPKPSYYCIIQQGSSAEQLQKT